MRRRSRRRVVYLLHFEQPYKHARHYLGSTDLPLAARVREHMRGRGAKLTAAAAAAGIRFIVARTWPGDRAVERQLHRRKDTPKGLCPICRAEYLIARACGELPSVQGNGRASR